MIDSQPLTVTIDGQLTSLVLDSAEPLVRAVVISLFTWRRASPDDTLPGDMRMGWWGDSFPTVPGDRIGSKLWLLTRSKLVPETVLLAREYAQESLQWLVDDGVAARVDVEAARIGIDALGLACRFYRDDGRLLADIRFTDVWKFLK